jgi:predicted  nucleic acid-binding Zn-ribbon protein
MSTQSKWKWAFIGLLIVVTLIGAGLWVNWRFTEMQFSFNQRVAANAANANAQIRALGLENEDLEEKIGELEQAILDLESWISEGLARNDQRIHNLEEDLKRVHSSISSMTSRLNSAWSEIYDLQGRVEYLEWLCEDGNCTAPEDGYKCPNCGTQIDPCDCYECWRWGCSCGCPYCDRYYGP